MAKKTRKRYTPEEKIHILREHLLEGRPVSDVCDENNLSPTVFYRWQKKLFEEGHKAFERKNTAAEKRRQKQMAKLEDQVAQKNEVIGELMGEYVDLKKKLGES